MKPERNTITHGHNIDIMKKWPPEFIDTILCSPPYFGLRDYDVPPVMWYPPDYQGCDHETEVTPVKKQTTPKAFAGRMGTHGGVGRREKPSQNIDINTNNSWSETPKKDIQLQAGNPEFQRPWREQASSSFVSTSRGGRIKRSQDFDPKQTKITKPQFLDVKSRICKLCDTWYGQLGLEPTFQMYLSHLYQIFDECWRLLKPTGSLWVVLGDSYSSHNDQRWAKQKTRGNTVRQQVKGIKPKTLLGIPQRFQIGMVDRGWICRNEIIWEKPNPLPSSTKDRFTVNFEKIFFFVKQQKYFFETQYEPYKSADQYRNYVYTGRKLENKDYDKAKAQDPSASKTRILKSMESGLGRIKRTVWEIGPSKEELLSIIDTLLTDYKTDPQQMESVWRINTRSYAGAHFAVFPEELVRTPILATCPQSICKKCLRPQKWQHLKRQINTRPGKKTGTSKSGTDADPHKALHQSDLSKFRQEIERFPVKLDSCDCNAGWDRGIIFDPFMGRGTVAKVAMDLGRDWLGIDLGEGYIKLANKYLGFDTSKGQRRGNLFEEFEI